MSLLSREDLVSKVISTIENEGWKIESKSDASQFPIRLEMSKDEELQILRFYIWNLTHGGTSRPPNEYRIQVKVDRFEEEGNSKTLILGFWDEHNVFAGFDIRRHIGKPGWSSSMQIKKEVLDEAATKGIAVYGKDNDEIAVAFQPKFLLNYVDDYYELHSSGNLNKYFPEIPEEAIEDGTETEALDFRYSITSYGADYPVDSIVSRIESDVIFVPPFQRKFVWSLKEASRFIESLLLGLPVPGIFLSKEKDTGRLLILDGQQRLFSLFSFYKNNFKGRPFKLKGVQSDLENKTYEELKTTDKFRLNDSIIHATVVKQDDPDDSESSIYLIFERLNSSGKVLTPQEIRASVYYGDFNEYLNKIVLEKDWRDMFLKMNDRLKEQELVLRFFALYFEFGTYQRPLKGFLNTFMHSNRSLEKYQAVDLDAIILPVIGYLNAVLGAKAFRMGGRINAAVFDAISIGLAKRIVSGAGTPSKKEFINSYNELLADPQFQRYTRESTADEKSVIERIRLAISKFENLPDDN